MASTTYFDADLKVISRTSVMHMTERTRAKSGKIGEEGAMSSKAASNARPTKCG